MVVDKMQLWLKELSICFPAQLMETLNHISNGTMKKLEQRFQVKNGWKHGKVDATSVLQVTMLDQLSMSHSA